MYRISFIGRVTVLCMQNATEQKFSYKSLEIR